MSNAVRMFDEDLEAFCRVRLRTLELVRPLTQEQLDQAPAPGKWSVGETVEHIILAAGLLQRDLEALIQLKRSGRRPFLRRTFSDIDIGLTFVPKASLLLLEIPFSLLSSFLIEPVRAYFTRNRLIRFRAATEATPRHGLPADELNNRLLTSLESVRRTYEINADLDFRELVAQHPLTGYLNMLELLRFMTNHELRHQKQILEALQLAGRRVNGVDCR